MSLDPFSDLALDDDPDVDGSVLTITRSGGVVTTLAWVDSVNSKTLKTVSITRSGGLVSTVTTSVYKQDGVTIGSQKVETFARTANVVTTITTTRPV